jgi:hypothetical protein
MKWKIPNTHKLPKLTKEIENLNRSIISKEIESVIFKNPEKEKLSTDGFTGEFYQIFKEEIIQSYTKTR